jgi:hypothetical protein
MHAFLSPPLAVKSSSLRSTAIRCYLIITRMHSFAQLNRSHNTHELHILQLDCYTWPAFARTGQAFWPLVPLTWTSPRTTTHGRSDFQTNFILDVHSHSASRTGGHNARGIRCHLFITTNCYTKWSLLHCEYKVFSSQQYGIEEYCL